jgi:hypothetical protein
MFEKPRRPGGNIASAENRPTPSKIDMGEPGHIEYTSKLAKTDEPIQRLFNCMEKTVEES